MPSSMDPVGRTLESTAYRAMHNKHTAGSGRLKKNTNKTGVSNGILLLQCPTSNRYAVLPCRRDASSTATSRAEAVATELVWWSVVAAVRLRKFRGLAPKLFFGGAGSPKSLLTMVIFLPPPAPPLRTDSPPNIN